MATKTRAPTSDFATGGTVAYSSGSTGFNLTNDYPDTADPLTSYVTFGTTTNSFIAFGFTAMDVPAGSIINSVQVQYTDEEPANGANTAAGRLRIGGTYYDAATHNPSTTTTARADSWTQNPRTTAAWTVADVNGTGANPLQNFGVIGPDSNPVWRLGSIQLLVDYTPPATGTLAATESGSDAAALAGDVIVKGTVGATESGNDTLAASGTVADSAVTGSLAATESGADTAVLTGTVLVDGSLAANEADADTFAAVGDVLIRGALAATEAGADTFAAAGNVRVAGALAANEAGGDTLAAAGAVPISGTLAAVETGADTFAAAGIVDDNLAIGSLAATESGADTAAVAGTVPVRGTAAATEAGQDTAAALGLVLIIGGLSATETSSDTFAAAGGSPAIFGQMAAQESGSDTFAGLGPIRRRATVARPALNGHGARPPALASTARTARLEQERMAHLLGRRTTASIRRR